MKYTQKAFERAEAELRNRQLLSENEHNARMAEISEKLPEVYRLNNEAIKMNYSLMSFIGQGIGNKNVSDKINEVKEKRRELVSTIHNMLETCGYPADYLQYHYYCENCRDTGYKEGMRCECMKQLLKKYTTEEINSHCSIDLHDFSEFRLDYYSTTSKVPNEDPRAKMSMILDQARAYAASFDENAGSLLFIGRTGLGKTFLSSCIAKELIEKGSNVVYGSLLKLMRQVENEHFQRAEGDTMSILLEADLLILDDLGAEFQTQFTDTVLYEILNERMNNHRPMIISTNLNANELNQKYNDRIISRIFGGFVPFAFVGSDVRIKKIKN